MSAPVVPVEEYVRKRFTKFVNLVIKTFWTNPFGTRAKPTIHIKYGEYNHTEVEDLVNDMANKFETHLFNNDQYHLFESFYPDIDVSDDENGITVSISWELNLDNPFEGLIDIVNTA